MRIAYVCADPGVPIGGQKGCCVHVREVIGALREQGADVEVFAARVAANTLPAELEKLAIHCLDSRSSTNCRAARERAALDANYELYARLLTAGPFDLVYERYSLWSYAGMVYAHDRQIPGLLEVNAPLIEEQATHRKLVNHTRAEQVAHRVFTQATALLPVSEEVAAYLRAAAPAGDRIHILPNGVNPHRFAPGLTPAHPAPPGVFTVGFVGSLKPWHGVSILSDAFTRFHRQHSQSRLLIVGDGPERDQLNADVISLGIADVTDTTGAVAPEAIPALLASMDVAVAPYPLLPAFYFSPLKVYEYMASGLPVVASCMGQLAHLIQDGQNGLLCPPGDPMALAQALGHLYRDRALCHHLGQAARRTILCDHTWSLVAQRILHIAQAAPISASERL
ncbi:glycosyltransferase family 4 protein [Candidatus Entotheonella palauensis]|uniref:glycosyltransferase family 4 protein n=1 Tax=Candidatus Entotheonella palauensis TaxID=93172 RepID=UPI000B7E703B|nr:glycosyltransferase family 4 protein [Candidatus Entotheonella palauensis]